MTATEHEWQPYPRDDWPTRILCSLCGAISHVGADPYFELRCTDSTRRLYARMTTATTTNEGDNR